MKKLLAVGVIVLFLGLAIAPSTGTIRENHCSINDYIEPSNYVIKSDTRGVDVEFLGLLGDNGWYISCVHISFTWSPDVAKIWFYIDGGDWIEYSKPFGPICDDGLYTVCWRYIDVHGHISDIECEDFMIDQTVPVTGDICWEAYEINGKWFVVFSIDCSDATSGMNRVEFYMNEELQKKIIGPGPYYDWELELDFDYSVIGFICKRNITAENVSFYAIRVRYNEFLSSPSLEELYTINTISYDNAGNFVITDIDIPITPPFPEPSIWFTNFTFTNDYRGYIGRFFIWAQFENKPLEIK